MTETQPAQRIAEIKRELDELQASLPAHSIKASMLQRIEDLEDELAELLAQQHPTTSW